MKAIAIKPQETVNYNGHDLTDVEIELVVARLNCILAKQYRGKTIYVPAETITGTNLGFIASTSVLSRFRKSGWDVGFHNSSENKRNYYTFSQKP
jgi:hypothetical protein